MFRLDGSSWTNILQSQSNFSYIGGISDESIFVAGTLGEVWHYNGKDWFQYKELLNPDITYSGVWTDGKEVFIVGYDLPYSFVFHGK